MSIEPRTDTVAYGKSAEFSNLLADKLEQSLAVNPKNFKEVPQRLWEKMPEEKIFNIVGKVLESDPAQVKNLNNFVNKLITSDKFKPGFSESEKWTELAAKVLDKHINLYGEKIGFTESDLSIKLGLPYAQKAIDANPDIVSELNPYMPGIGRLILDAKENHPEIRYISTDVEKILKNFEILTQEKGSVSVKSKPPMNLQNAAKHGVDLALSLNETVKLKFNSQTLLITPQSTREAVVQAYDAEIQTRFNRDPVANAANDRFEASFALAQKVSEPATPTASRANYKEQLPTPKDPVPAREPAVILTQALSERGRGITLDQAAGILKSAAAGKSSEVVTADMSTWRDAVVRLSPGAALTLSKEGSNQSTLIDQKSPGNAAKPGILTITDSRDKPENSSDLASGKPRASPATPARVNEADFGGRGGR